MFGRKKFWSEKIFWVKNNFGLEKFFGPKIFLGHHPHKLNANNISAVTDPILLKV